MRSRIALLLIGVSGLPASARAFSDYELFSLPTTEGGGGGRYFTGSSSDGYTCGVCHLGGAKPTVQLRGLPESQFLPGTAYDVELAWQPGALHALNLEFVAPNGQAAGSIVLPDPSTLEPADRCDAMHEGAPAAQLIAESAPRQVLWVDDCGAQRVRFRYVAPTNVAQLMFAASVVRTDGSEKPEGDGVTELRHDLSISGTANTDDGCSLQRPGRSGSRWLLGAAIALALAWRRLRRRAR
jgi:hypothetical protein